MMRKDLITIALSEKEARALIKEFKRCAKEEIEFPDAGQKKDFDAYSLDNRHQYTIHIYRGRLNPLKYNLSARLYSDVLLELHINPTNRHMNPDGTLILSSHWHIYSEKYGLKEAHPADLDAKDFVDNTILFLKTFNVVNSELPHIIYQNKINDI